MEDTWVLRFLITVWWMRKRQIAWFRHHNQSDLIFAKQHESEVDRELMKRLIIVGGEPIGLDVPVALDAVDDTPKQANLFSEDDHEAQ